MKRDLDEPCFREPWALCFPLPSGTLTPSTTTRMTTEEVRAVMVGKTQDAHQFPGGGDTESHQASAVPSQKIVDVNAHFGITMTGPTTIASSIQIVLMGKTFRTKRASSPNAKTRPSTNPWCETSCHVELYHGLLSCLLCSTYTCYNFSDIFN